MKPKEPTFLIAYPSTFNINGAGTETFSLSFTEEYFVDSTLQVDIDGIETFALSDSCPMFYFLSKDGYFHIYDIDSKKIEKNIFHIMIANQDKVKDIVSWNNVMFVLTTKEVRAYSLITWQLLWDFTIDILQPESMAIDSAKNIYILNGANENESTVVKYTSDGAVTETIQISDNPFSIFIEKEQLLRFEISKMTVRDLSSGEENIVKFPKLSETYDKEIDTIEKIVRDKKRHFWILSRDGELTFIDKKRVFEPSSMIAHKFDSTFEGCEWHKIELAFDTLDKGGLVRLEVRAYDQINDTAQIFQTFDNSPHIYLQNITGRYLEVKVTLFSDPQQTSSPVFYFFKVDFPKMTYLEYLPAFYQEDVQSKVLLQKYLSLFQTITGHIEDKIENSHLLIDPLTTSTEFLEWLSLWLGLKMEKNWSEEKWRAFLAKALYFFKTRGTREGLSQMIQFYLSLESEPIILEPFQLKCKDGKKVFKWDNFTFCVLFEVNQIQKSDELQAVKRMIEVWKPAHTKGRVSVLKNEMRLGNIIILEKNSYLQGKEEPFILGKAVLPVSTQLADREENMQIQSRARVGIDTKLNYDRGGYDGK